MKRRHIFMVQGLAAVIALAGCSKEQATAPAPPAAPPTHSRPSPAPAFTVIEIQTAIVAHDDSSSAQPTVTFAPADRITALVFTRGSGSHELSAHWTRGADRPPVHQEQIRVDTSGTAVHPFHFSNADGLPAGDYQVEVQVDGAPQGRRRFKVE